MSANTTPTTPSPSKDRLSTGRSHSSILPFRGGYAFGLALVGALLFGALQVFGRFSYPVDFAITAVAALPSMTFGLCLLASRKARAVAVFKPGSLLSLMVGGRILSTAIVAVLALSGTYFMLHELRGCQPWERAVLASVALLLPAVCGALDHLLFRGVRLYVRRSLALLTACGVAAGLAAGVYFFLGQSLAAGRTPVGLADEIAAARQAVASLSGNVLAREVAQTMAFFSGLKAHLCASPAGESLRLFLIVAAGKWASFFAVATMIGLFLLPGREWMRGFAPLSDSDVPPRPEPLPAGIAIAVVGIAWFAMFHLGRNLDGFLESNPGLSGVRRWMESKIIEEVEEFEGVFYKRGTLAAVENLRNRLMAEGRALVADNMRGIERAIDDAFAACEANVETYLDWYYSLKGDYSRLAAMAAWQFEEYLRRQMRESIISSEAFRVVHAEIERHFRESTALEERFEEGRKAIFDASRIEAGGRSLRVVETRTNGIEFSLPQPPEFTRLVSRAGFSLTVGTGAGVLAGKVTTELIEKTMQKLVASAPFKKVVQVFIKNVLGKAFSRWAAATAGGAAGGAGGSWLGPYGAAIGAGVGIVAGLGTFVAVDKVAIEIEEAFHREEHKQELLRFLRKARQDLKTELGIPAS